jgi:hypothetical protein
VQVAADCMLALHGIDPDSASDWARAGAIRQVEHQALLNAFVKGIAASLTSKR